ncbi:MAG: phosphoribosylanthranilate isomerase [Candidatus Eremiobacteraeota bacterium]|nr:phosphoribosylanthranilate isomerase [Candidatus Eremiobacteraeota bacterium]
MTSPDDVALAVEAGADAVGIIVSRSPRRVDRGALAPILAAVPPFVAAVIVCANETEADIDALAARGALLQFSGAESPEYCERLAAGARYLKAFHVRAEDGLATFDRATLEAYPNALCLVDSSAGRAFGGTGKTFDWSIARELARERPIVVSGGLEPENVGDCVRAVRPFAVDVRSGIETGGLKDALKMRAFVRSVRAADADVTVLTAPNV